ncbi:MAG: bifunctional ornithine acetyltransferase/N-acetylglutamate synthase, partial [Bacillota bacterium]|nr:bifunctional ornithine acetyltransferase/N-acetylglutamate synthase [Bacillota bacterium]
MISNIGLSAVEGFEFAGIDAGGIKNHIGLLHSKTEECYGVAVYTKSDVKAAPVIISKANDEKTSIKRAIVLNSGNANAFTGEKGLNDAKASALKVSEILSIKPEEVYVGSTGVIGREMELEVILNGIEKASKELKEGEESAVDFVKAIMTTDTKVKQASISFEIDGKTVHIASCVKGAGMLKPDMATMLCVITTDAKISPEMMSKALSDNVEDTFNCITIDGDTSTNDTIFLLANGLAGNKSIEAEDENYNIFKSHLREVMEHMAKQVVNDGEGVTKFITLKVVNTPAKEKAKAVALSIGNSPLVK